MITEKRNYIFDFDSTLTRVEALDVLAEITLQDNPKKGEIIQEIIDITNLDLNESYEQVKNELRNYSTKLVDKKELVVLNKIDLIDEDTAKDIIDHFSKGKNCEIMTMTTLEKDSISKIKAKLLSYVS